MRGLWVFLFIIPSFSQASFVKVAKDANGWQLLVDSVPYFIRGFSYVPDKVGEDPNIANYRDWMIVDDNANGKIDVAYDSWVDANKNDTQDGNEPTVGDFQLMKNMGVNTIRIYHHPSDNPSVQALFPAAGNPGGALLFNHAPNKALLRDLFSTYGIRVAMGDELGSYTTCSSATYSVGTDYTDPVQLQNMRTCVVDMVTQFKDEPWLLMYILGNENNYSFNHTNASTHPDAYYNFVDSMTVLIHSMDPQHPVGISNGETQFMSNIQADLTHIDIIGINSYRAPGTFTGFGTLWTDVSSFVDHPVMLTEYGLINPIINAGVFDESYQTANLKSYALDIQEHAYGRSNPKNSIGGFDFNWLDNWWQDGNPNALDTTTGANNETTGIIGQGTGTHSNFERQLKDAYFMYQKLWTGNYSHKLNGHIGHSGVTWK